MLLKKPSLYYSGTSILKPKYSIFFDILRHPPESPVSCDARHPSDERNERRRDFARCSIRLALRYRSHSLLMVQHILEGVKISGIRHLNGLVLDRIPLDPNTNVVPDISANRTQQLDRRTSRRVPDDDAIHVRVVKTSF